MCFAVHDAPKVADSDSLHQAEKLRLEIRKVRVANAGFRMNHEVPARGDFVRMTANNLSDAPPDAIPPYRSTKCFLDAEPKAADRQLVRAKKNSEMGT